MNKLVAKFAGLMVIVLVFTMSATMTSCDKEINCKAVITVKVQATGQPMVGAQVEVKNGDVSIGPTATDGSGTVNFETNLPMILDIYVNGAQTGRVARFEDDKTDNVVVEL